MGFDLDPFDDIFPDGVANNARPGGKFRPKAKLRPRKESSVSVRSTQSTQPVSIAENELIETLRTEKPSENNVDDFSGVPPSYDNRSSGLPNPLSEHLATRESIGPIIGMHSEAIICDSNRGWHSCFGKSEGENGDIFFGLELLDDFLPRSTTITETPTVHVAGSRNAEVGFGTAVVSPADHTTRVCNTANACTSPELPANLDPLTCGAAGDFHVENRRLETEVQEAEGYPCLETLDTMPELTTSSGRRNGKFQPKPQIQSHKEKHSATVTNPEAAESIWRPDDANIVPSQTEYLDVGSAFPPDDVIDFSSMEFDDSIPTNPTFELPVNEEPTNLTGTSQSDAAIPGEHPETVTEIPANVVQSAKRGKRTTHMVSDLSVKDQQTSTYGQEYEAGRSLRRRSKRIHVRQLVDESEDEGLEDGQSPAECPSVSVINEDNHTDEEYQLENESQHKRVRGKSKKPITENGKPVRKRKKANEVSDQSSKNQSKKFSHSTRKRGRFDKDWLQTPEDEIEISNLPLKDIILLGEYREWIANKKPKTSETPLKNQSSANSSAHYDEDDVFASEQGQESNDEQENEPVQESSIYFNYHTHMVKTPRGRWTKQDTELFYEAVRQFGTDLSMITELFPDRTRKQIKLKYKKEERKDPKRLHEALTNRAKDHSHFELVVERLRKTAAERRQNSNRDDSDGLTGEEAEEVAPETNEEVAKSEQFEQEEVPDMEAGIPAVQSPAKSSDSEDDDYRWSQYKSEI